MEKENKTLEEIISGKSSLNQVPESKQLAWCTHIQKKTTIIDLNTKEAFFGFDSTKLKSTLLLNCLEISDDFLSHKASESNTPQVKAMPNTSLLINLAQTWLSSASMEIYDISSKEEVDTIYKFDEVFGSILSFLILFLDLAFVKRL